jgi:hypothetical protein
VHELVEEEGTLGKSLFRLWLTSYLVISVSQLLQCPGGSTPESHPIVDKIAKKVIPEIQVVLT